MGPFFGLSLLQQQEEWSVLLFSLKSIFILSVIGVCADKLTGIVTNFLQKWKSLFRLFFCSCCQSRWCSCWSLIPFFSCSVLFLAECSEVLSPNPQPICDFDGCGVYSWIYEETVWAQRWTVEWGSLCFTLKTPWSSFNKRSYFLGGQKKRTLTETRVRLTSPPISSVIGANCLFPVCSIDFRAKRSADGSFPWSVFASTASFHFLKILFYFTGIEWISSIFR